MNANKTPQFFLCGCRLVDGIPEPLENLACLELVKLNQDIILVFEIKVDGSVRHAGFFGNLGNRRLKKTLFGEYLDGSTQDALVFIHIFYFRTDSEPPGGNFL
jgi:hypothetical protein